MKVAAAEYGVKERRVIANVTGLPSFAYCDFDDCDLGFPLRYPEVAAEAILQRFGS